MRRIMKLGALALGLLVPLGATAAAQAAAPVPFTITEEINFVLVSLRSPRPGRCARRARSSTM